MSGGHPYNTGTTDGAEPLTGPQTPSGVSSANSSARNRHWPPGTVLAVGHGLTAVRCYDWSWVIVDPNGGKVTKVNADAKVERLESPEELRLERLLDEAHATIRALIGVKR